MTKIITLPLRLRSSILDPQSSIHLIRFRPASWKSVGILHRFLPFPCRAFQEFASYNSRPNQGPGLIGHNFEYMSGMGTGIHYQEQRLVLKRAEELHELFFMLMSAGRKGWG